VLVNEAWASGSSLTTARRDPAGFGAQNAAVGAAGYGGSGYTSVTEEYNGSGWAAGTAYPGAVASMGSTGSQTAGLVFGASGPGTPNSATYEYDGSSWTAGNSLGTGRYDAAGAGIQTAALAYGGSITTNVESYNGSTWTATTALNTARRGTASVGTQTAALAAGGKNSPSPSAITSNVEEWDGSSWTEVNNLPAATFLMGSAGIQTDALVFGGSDGAPVLSTTSGYDGTNWSAKPNMATARDRIGSGQYVSPSSAAIAFAGNDPNKKLTEEFTSSANVITAAAFSSGGAANFARRQLGYTGAGTQNAFMVYGGFSPSGMVNNSEEYGGATWTATPTLNTARGQDAGFGITTAAVCCGGATPTIGGYTEEFNGSSWTTGNSMSTSRYEFGGTGILTAGLALQGDQGPSTPFGITCEQYDGTNWSSAGTANTARRTNSGVGTLTATITAGGQTSPGATANVESYDGTSFSEVNNLNVARSGNAVMGGPAGATSSVITGGNVPTQFSISEQWNGTSMVTGANMANDRSTHGAGGTSALGIVGLGQTGPSPPYGDALTEEYVGETTELNVKTLTQS